MDLQKENEKRRAFSEILFELSRSQERLRDARYRSEIYQRLEMLYYAPKPKDCFRHFYSDIFSVLTQVKQSPDTLGDINILGQNLLLIRNGYQAINKDENGKLIDISDSIRKLYDHVSLDIARMLYSDDGDRKLRGEENLKEIKSHVNSALENINKEIGEVQKEAEKKIGKVQDEAEEKIRNQQKEYIAILGIFAAVVLAFTGGIAFSTSVLNNIAQVSVYRIVLLALVIGLVLVNTLFGLFYYINKIVCREGKILPLLISNLILIVLIAAVVLAWHFGWVENRGRRLERSASSNTVQTDLE